MALGSVEVVLTHLDSFGKWLLNSVHFLIDPSPHLKNVSHRRQAQSLAAIQLLFAPVAVVVLIVEILTKPQFPESMPLTIGSFIATPILYFLARSRYAPGGCWLQVAVSFCTISASILIAPEQGAGILFLTFPIVLAALLVGDKGVIIIGSLTLVELGAWVEFYSPPIELSWMHFGFFVLFVLLTLFVGQQDKLIERDRAKGLLDKEQRQRTLLEATFDGIAIVQDGTIIEVNDGFGELFGCVAAQCLNTPISRWVPSLDHGVASSTNVGMGLERALGYPIEGEPFDVEQMESQYGESQDVLQLVAVRDISVQLANDAQLQHTRRMASIGHLAATVAHEINNPLAVMRLRVDAMGHPEMQQPLGSHLTVLGNHINRISHIVRNMRSFSKPAMPVWETLAVSSMMTDAQRIVSGTVPNVQMHWHLRPPNLCVRVDKAQIEQVLVNLMLFAASGTDNDQVVDIYGYAEREWIRLIVRCQGRGMNLETIRGCFSPVAHEAGNSTGTAVGLMLSWGIVQEYGGTMHASESPTGGGQIEFTLPGLAQEETAQ